MVARPVPPKSIAPKWTPLGIVQRLRRLVRQPSDIGLALQIGYFMWRLPAELRQRHLGAYLSDLRLRRGAGAHDVFASVERIVRLRDPWLKLRLFRERDNCYVRALTLYRFIDRRESTVLLHFGIEEPADPVERLRGHAWVSVDGKFFEGPPQHAVGRLREMFLPSASP